MRETRSIIRPDGATGDVAVEGLFSGMIAGLAMVTYLALAALTFGEGPLTMLIRFRGSDASTPLVGLLLHLGVSGVYGIIFALICKFTARSWGYQPSSWLAASIGAGYGLALWLLAQWVILPGLNSPLMEIPRIHFFLGHQIFGISLGLLTQLEARK